MNGVRACSENMSESAALWSDDLANLTLGGRYCNNSVSKTVLP
jgi:hypothetical protein